MEKIRKRKTIPFNFSDKHIDYIRKCADNTYNIAEGAVRAAGADASVVTTGVAGPGGGTEEKPVGLVYIGCCVKGRTIVKRCFYGGNRQGVRHSAVKEALEILYCQLLADKY